MTSLIYETVHGSQCYGLARAGSDLDLKGIIVGPKHWYLGHTDSPEQVEHSGDHVHYELRKFLRLAAKANPTVLELLFTDPADHRVRTKAIEPVMDFRERFLTKQVADTFGGYAVGQLKRIRTHRQWLLNPPKEKPTREAFGLADRRFSRDQIGAANTLVERASVEGATLDLPENFMDFLAKEKRYQSATARYKQYLQWQKHRNVKRSALEAKHGYDTKHAMHLIRLQRMAIEILQTNEVRVRRSDRDELLAIRDGVWSFDELIEHSDRNGRTILESKEQSDLPESLDADKVRDLSVSVIESVLQLA